MKRRHLSIFHHINVPAAYVSIRQHISGYVSIRQHTSASCLRNEAASFQHHLQHQHCRRAAATRPAPALAYVSIRQHASAYVSIRQHTSTCVSIRQHTSACVSIRQHTSACVSMRQHTSASVSIRTSAYVNIPAVSHYQQVQHLPSYSLNRPSIQPE